MKQFIEKIKKTMGATKKVALGQLIVGVLIGAGVALLFTAPKDSHNASEHAAASASQAADAGATVWTCSMHPQIRQPEPGLCPLCGMDLIPLASKGGEEPGPQTVVLSERAKILARIGTTAVRRQQTTGADLRLLGRIEANESAMKNVTAWIGGRIDRLQVKATGQKVRAGQTIATLYSPEIYAAHQDLLIAKKQVQKMAGGLESAKQASVRAYDASKNRLRLLGVPESVITELEQQETPTTRIAIRSPFAGTVVERVATEGAYVQTGALLYRIVNLTTVWVQLDAYEGDLPLLTLGQEVHIHVEGISNATFTGKITFIDPTLDAVRRIARVRVEVDNKEGQLRPGMFVEADVMAATQKGALLPLLIPETAPLFTGRRAIVFVEDPTAERPTYTARTVRLGLRNGTEYPVIAGLSEGERVVTKGAFTLDADLQIRGGDSMMTTADDNGTPKEDLIIGLTATERARLAPVLTAYLALQKALAADDFQESIAAATRLDQATAKAQIAGPAAAAAFWKQHRKQLRSHATELIKKTSIEDVRGIFEGLSNDVILLLERLGNPLDSAVRLAFCPMAMGSKGAHWIQSGEVVDNSYYGNAMRTCGEIQSTVDGGAYLLKPAHSTAGATAASTGGHSH